MTDAAMRAMVDQLPVPEFETTPWTPPPPLSAATVAIVTTAALRRHDDPPFPPEDASFRELPAEARNLTIGHLSPNWDRSGIAADLNVVYPIDRLVELAEEGVVGTVAPRHLSFHGVVEGTFDTMLLDSGPAAARLLRDDGVDVVLLTPV